MSWLDMVPDKFADMLNEGKIDYDSFLELTEQYRTKGTYEDSMKRAIRIVIENKNNGLDLIG